MTDVKRLLAEATSLPWGRDGRWLDTGDIDPYERDLLREPGRYGASVGAVHRFPHGDINGDANAELILYAVNHLPDYLAAVEALEAVLPFVGMSLSISGHDVECTLNPCSCGVIEKHNAAVDALARLRDEVTA